MTDDSSDGDEIVEDDDEGSGEIMGIEDGHDDDSIVLSNNTSDNENEESDIKEDSNWMGEKYVILIGKSNCKDVLWNVPYKSERQVASGTAIFDIESVIILIVTCQPGVCHHCTYWYMWLWPRKDK